MPIPRFNRTAVVAISALVVLAVVGAGVWAGRREAAAQRIALAENAGLAARSLVDRELELLKASESELRSITYLSLRRRMELWSQVRPSVSRAFVLRREDPRGPVVFLADSSALGVPGALISPAPLSWELQTALVGGISDATFTSIDDSGHGWLAFAAVTAHEGASRRHVVGLVAAREQWERDQWRARIRGGLIALLFLGAPWTALVVAGHRSVRTARIRNLSVAIDQIDALVVIVSPDERVDYANRALCRQLGKSSEELIGRRWKEIGLIDGKSQVAREMFAALDQGQGWSGEWELPPSDGRPAAFCLGAATPVRGKDGSLACTVCVCSDVTSEHQRQSELREAQALALSAEQAKRQFLTAVSHEVRTPLNGIVGFGGLLADSALDSDQRMYVDAILSSADSMVEITGDLIDYARMTSGRMRLEEGPLAIEECVGSAVDRVAPRAEAKGLELSCRLDPAVPAAVRCDAARLTQVLVNLLNNAVKFTDKGHVELAVRVLPPRTPDRLQIEFSVTDTGIGIDPKHHESIFRQFSQIDDAPVQRRGGLGLGLAIARHLVELMGGRLAVASELGYGATFSFSLSVVMEIGDTVARNLNGLKVGIVAPAGRSRDLLVQLMSDWRAATTVDESTAALPAEPLEAVLLSLTATRACEIARDGIDLGEMRCGRVIALVPHALPREVRNALQPYFSAVLNRPPHRADLHAALAPVRRAEPAPEDAPMKFDFSVLVAEDNSTSQWLMREMLTALGCRHHLVGSGQEVIDELKSNPSRYDLLLLDLHMPEVDGLSVLRTIRAGGAGAAVQAIWTVALTAEVRMDHREIAFAGGINDYLLKPLRLEVLITALRRYAEARKRGAIL